MSGTKPREETVLSPTSAEAVAKAVEFMREPAARARTPTFRSRTPTKPSAPGEKRDTACVLPQLWREDPRLADVQEMLEDVMTRIHDWGDLFDMVRGILIG